MSRAAGGTYTLPAGNPVVTATVISSTWANNTLSDIGTALTDSLSRSGLGGMSAPLLGVDGTNALPGFSFNNEPSSGFYRNAAGQLSLSLLGVQKFLFGSTDESTGLSLLGKGPVIGIARSSDSSANAYQLGSSGVGTSIFRITNTSGGASLIDLGSTINLSTNAGVSRFAIVVATGAITQWEGSVNVAAAGLMNSASYESGTFTGTLTGCTTAPTMTINWRRVGPVVTLDWGANLVALSNSTSCTITGMTAALAPARVQRSAQLIQDNSTNQLGQVSIAAGGVVLILVKSDGLTTSFTAANNKGLGIGSMTYNLN